MTRISKIILTTLACLVLSIAAQLVVAMSGYTIYESIDEAEIKSSIGRFYTEEEMRIRQKKADEFYSNIMAQYDASSALEKHQYLKAASWHYTWIPWIILGLIIRLKSIGEWLVFLVPLGTLTIFNLVWLRELLLIILVVSMVSYTRTYLLNGQNNEVR